MGCTKCNACPFSYTEEAEMAQNYGCLPAPYEIMEIKRNTGLNWACHEDETRICSGFVSAAKEMNMNYKSGGLAVISKWGSNEQGY